MTAHNPTIVNLNGIIVDFTNRQIHRDGYTSELEGQSLKVLSILVSHHPHTVTREQILNEAWAGLVVSDNSLSQCITTLRKSLGDDSKTPKFIRTVPRKGYQLVAELHKPATTAGPQEEMQNHRNNWGLRALIISLIVLVIGVTLSLLWKFNQPISRDVDISAEHQSLLNQPYVPSRYLSSKPGVEAFVTFSPSGNILAYSETSSADNYDLVLLNLTNNSHSVILNSPADEYVAAWSPDERWLAYIVQTHDYCEIRIMPISQEGTAPESSDHQKIRGCQPNEFPPSVSWSKDNKLYLAITEHGLPTLKILAMQYHPESGRFIVGNETLVDDIRPELIDLSPDNKHLLFSEINHDKYHYRLASLDLDTMVTKDIETRSSPFWGISWHGSVDSVLHGGQLTQHKLSGDKYVLYHSPNYVFDLDYHKSGKLVVSEGTPNFNLYVHQLSPDVQSKLGESTIAPSTQLDYLPALTPSEEHLAFISSRNSRNHLSIWITEFPSGTPTHVKDLPVGFIPLTLSWSPDEKYLLIVSNQRIAYLLSLNTRELRVLTANQRAFYPHWVNGSNHIRYNVKAGSEWRRVIMNTETLEQQFTPNNTAAIAMLNDGRNIVFDSTTNKVLIEENNINTLLFSYENIDELTATQNGIYYFINSDQYSDIHYVDFKTAESGKRQTTNSVSQYAGIPRNIAASEAHLIIPRAGPHQTDLILLERAKNN